MAATALISDIHGNIWALDAVLQDIQQRGITQIINLGDSLYGSLAPAATANRLMQWQIPSICGNQDRIILDPDIQSADQVFIHQQLSKEHLEWLSQMPTTLIVGSIFCCHGTPISDTTYLLETVTPQGVFLSKGADIQKQIEGIEQPIIACGHSHVPRLVQLPDGRIVINPGSVGVPAYEDDLPYPHMMEAGSPHARYAVITEQAGQFQIELIAVPYDWDQAAAIAEQRGRPDRARWIRTGRA